MPVLSIRITICQFVYEVVSITKTVISKMNSLNMWPTIFWMMSWYFKWRRQIWHFARVSALSCPVEIVGYRLDAKHGKSNSKCLDTLESRSN